MGVDNFPGTVHGGRLASSHSWDGRPRVSGARDTAFEGRRPRAQSTESVATALGGPAAVPSAPTRGLGAAFDIGGSAGAGTGDVSSAVRGT